MAKTCGAKTSSGDPCKRAPSKGKTRCKLHGGASTGPKPETQNALTHGIYAKYLTSTEIAESSQIEIGNLDALIRMAHIQHSRAWAARERAQNTLELEEETTSIAGLTQKHRLVDYDSKIDKCMARIGSLEMQRKALMESSDADVNITIEGGFIATNRGTKD